MRWYDIRARVLVATVVPVTVVAGSLSAVFMTGRLQDIELAQAQQETALVRQLAAAAEFAVFTGSVDSLQSLVNGAIREPDVRSVVVFDVAGRALVKAGSPRLLALPESNSEVPIRTQILAPVARSESGAAAPSNPVNWDVVTLPISSTTQALGDLFEVSRPKLVAPGQSKPLGRVVIEFSRDALHERRQQMLALGAAVTSAGLFLGWLFALRIGRGVVQPVMRVSGMIERIGAGDFSTFQEVHASDPLADMQHGLNDMARRLELGRDQLQAQVAIATLELREKKEEAETATLAKSRFLAAASHDLRQPAHAMGMFVARLSQLPADPHSRELVSGLEASVSALQDMLDALLDLSRLEAASVQVRALSFPVQGLWEQLRHGFMSTAAAKGIRLRIRPSDAWLQTDPILLHRVLLNLVSNALRYTSHGAVHVSCRVLADSNHVRIDVRDSGPGIARELQTHIFSEFFQIGNVERDRTKGLGLGLSIVERTCRLLDLPLTLASAPGRGSRFCITVPLARMEVAATHKSGAEALPLEVVEDLAVMVIEDDQLSASAMAGLLQSWGCKVSIAPDGAAALELLKERTPDVIVSDYRLPNGQTGIDVISQLRGAGGRLIAACLMSGDTDAALVLQAKEAGLVLLQKPVRPAKLRSLLRRLGRTQSDVVRPITINTEPSA